MAEGPILVTGGSGFVGGHVVLALLAADHEVRTTVRSLAKEAEVRATLRANGGEDRRLSVVAADLEQDAGWAEAVAGCDFVHTTSPPPSRPASRRTLTTLSAPPARAPCVCSAPPGMRA